MSDASSANDSSTHVGNDSKTDEKHATSQDVEIQPQYDQHVVAGDISEVKELRQGLHSRHIQMIALAGTIGMYSVLPGAANISNLKKWNEHRLSAQFVCGTLLTYGQVLDFSSVRVELSADQDRLEL